MIKSYLIKLMILCSFLAFSCQGIIASNYMRKRPYAGMGKRSNINGMVKNKPISGYTRRTTRGYVYVNPYARSR